MKIDSITISPVNMTDRAQLGIRAGDTVSVHQKTQDKGKTRIQLFEGLVLARKHGTEPGATFTVRKMSDGIGVEKIFPLYSPMIDKIEITRRSKMRRAKLYYIRDKVTREIKRQMRRMQMAHFATESGAEQVAREAHEAEVETAHMVKEGAVIEAVTEPVAETEIAATEKPEESVEKSEV